MRHLPMISLLLAVITSGASMPAQDPAGANGVRLVYEMPVDAMQRQSRGQPIDLEQLLAQTVTTIAKRLGNDAKVTRDGGAGFVVDVQVAQATDLDAMRRRIEAPGTMTMAAIATTQRQVDPRRARSRRRQEAAGRMACSGGRDRVLADPAAIAACNDIAKTTHLQWIVHRLVPQMANPAAWELRLGNSPPLAPATVSPFTDQRWNGGEVPKAERDHHPFLIELVAIDLRLEQFSQRDLDLSSIVAQQNPSGWAVWVALQAPRCAAFKDWTSNLIGEGAAIACNGELLSAPIFRSAIPGIMCIEGHFTPAEAQDFAAALRSGELPAIPKLVRQETLPPTGK